MKTVLDKSTVAHYWANQVQETARVSGGNFYFNGKTIFSYGAHFPIAKHVNGKVLFTKRTYSNTTAKHIGLVRSACSHLPKIYCYEISAYEQGSYQHGQNLKRWQNDIESVLNKIKTARKKEAYFNEVLTLQSECKIYCEFFKIKPGKELKTLLAYQFADALQYTEKLKEAEAKELKLIETQGKKQYLRYVDLWHKNTEPKLINEAFTANQRTIAEKYANLHGFTLLRVRDNEVETSKGVTLPVDVAKRYLTAYLSGTMKQGDEVLNYRVKSVSPSELVIGCHNIPQSEIKYIQGLI